MKKATAKQIPIVFQRKSAKIYEYRRNEECHRLRSVENCENNFLSGTFCMDFYNAVRHMFVKTEIKKNKKNKKSFKFLGIYPKELRLIRLNTHYIHRNFEKKKCSSLRSIMVSKI